MFDYIYAFFLMFILLPYCLNFMWKLSKSLFKKSTTNNNNDNILVGYKSKIECNEGYKYAPYIPINYLVEEKLKREREHLRFIESIRPPWLSDSEFNTLLNNTDCLLNEKNTQINKYKNKKMIKFPLLK